MKSLQWLVLIISILQDPNHEDAIIHMDEAEILAHSWVTL